jgi:hypothetical protein
LLRVWVVIPLERALEVLDPLGGTRIGHVGVTLDTSPAWAPLTGRVLRTAYGSERVLVQLSSELLPRIC